MKRVLVSGATGFLGGHVCRYLCEKGYAVRAAVRPGSDDSGLPSGVQRVAVGDVGPDTEWSAALDSVSLVLHLAARAHRTRDDSPEDERACFLVNTAGTRRLARQVADASWVQRVVFVSSVGAVSSSATDPIGEATPSAPDTAYGRSKLGAEAALAEELAAASADWCVVRPPLIYGPGNPGNMERLLALVGTGLPLPLGSVHNRRSFIYVENLVEMLEICLWHPEAANRIFHVSDEQDLSTPDLVRRLARLSGRRPRVIPFPVSWLRGLGRIGDLAERVLGLSPGIDSYSVDRLVGSLAVDASLARERLGWAPRYSVEQGLRATVQSLGRSG